MTQPDVNVTIKPGQRIVIHDERGEAQVALIVDLDCRRGVGRRESFIHVQPRSHRMISYTAQEWVHPEDGEVI